MILRCKICGGDLSFQQGDRIATCEYCGREQTVPLVREESATLAMYERANSYRTSYEFDKAINIYDQIILGNIRDAEAYWNLVLCKYGVVYVKDPKTNSYIPTCSRTQYLSILNDENYLKAIENADETQKAVYVSDAKYIDEVQKGIIKIAKKEDPFDVFICYKESDDEGRRTQDSIRAQEIYDKLTEAGYKVFFSRITLESKVGIEFEPYIYAALSSSKVMIHITSSREYSNAVWVKNEWSRYLSLMNQNSDKVLIPVYFGMSKADLPEEFNNITSFDLESQGFDQELIRGVKKIIPHSVNEKRGNWIIPTISVAVLVVAIGVGVVLYTRNKADKEAAESLASSLAATTTTEATTIEITTQETENPELRAAYNAALDLAYEGRYAEAAWAFEDLGDFDDAEVQYQNMIISWRKSLATVCADITPINGDLGSYYITANGGVSTFDYNPGNLHTQYSINNHGKVVSVSSGSTELVVLYEDGYIVNCEYENVIEQSCVYRLYGVNESNWDDSNCFRLCLLSDGTIAVDDVNNDWDTNDELGKAFLNQFDEWNNIIDIVYSDSLGDRSDAPNLIIGIKADGTLVYCANSDYNLEGELSDISQDLRDFLDSASHVKQVSVYHNHFIDSYTVSLVTDDGSFSVYSDGDIFEYDSSDVMYVDLCDDHSNFWEYKYAGYALHSDGRITDFEGNLLLSDAVYIRNGYAVTRSGTIYCLNKDYAYEAGERTSVLDEWELG